jgi:hypothetical protein
LSIPEATVRGISILETAVCVTVSHTTTLADSSSVWAFVLTKGSERTVSPVAKYLEVEFTVQLWRVYVRMSVWRGKVREGKEEWAGKRRRERERTIELVTEQKKIDSAEKSH